MVLARLKVRLSSLLTSTKRVGRNVRKAAQERVNLHETLAKLKAEIEEKDAKNAPEKELTKVILAYDKTLKEILKDLEDESNAINLEEEELINQITKAEAQDQELARRYSGRVDLSQVNAELDRIHKRVSDRIRQIQLTSYRAMQDRSTIQGMLSRVGRREQRVLRQFRREVRRELSADNKFERELKHLENELKKGSNQVDTSKLLEATRNLGKELDKILAELYYLVVFLAEEHHQITQATTWDLKLLHRLEQMKLTPEVAARIQSQIREIENLQRSSQRQSFKLAKAEAKRAA